MRGLFGAIAAPGRKLFALDENMYPELRGLFGYPDSKSGFPVNWRTALGVSAVFACVRVIANGVAQVPWKVMKPDGEGSKPAIDHPLYDVISKRPNPWQTSFEFRRTLVFHRALTGNAYVFKNMVGGQIKELIPLDPTCVHVTRNQDLSLVYEVTSERNGVKPFPQDAIWHLREPSWNTWLGLDTVRYARESIGLAMAAERSQVLFHKNGMRTTGLFSIEGTLDDTQFQQLRGWIEAQVSGDDGYRPFLLDHRAKYTPMVVSSADAKVPELRKQQIEEIARAFGVFPQMIGHAGDQTPTFASAEQFFNAHEKHTLGPWYVDIQQSADTNLIAEGDDAFTKFIPNGLMFATAKDRSEYYKAALGSGGSKAWMEVNEVRGLDDLNPVDWGEGEPTPPRAPVDPAQEPKT